VGRGHHPGRAAVIHGRDRAHHRQRVLVQGGEAPAGRGLAGLQHAQARSRAPPCTHRKCLSSPSPRVRAAAPRYRPDCEEVPELEQPCVRLRRGSPARSAQAALRLPGQLVCMWAGPHPSLAQAPSLRNRASGRARVCGLPQRALQAAVPGVLRGARAPGRREVAGARRCAAGCERVAARCSVRALLRVQLAALPIVQGTV